MSAYYNEIDPFAAQWLRNLIAAGHIAPGEVDERSIADVLPIDLIGFDQCHFFAGLGGWSYALRLAGWPDDRPVWTGSCPCQPFSVAGKGRGTADERHLWPEFARLIAECSPATVFGEQVASRAGRDWLSSVRLDLEALGYAVGAADLCAAGAGAPHIRQRLYWVANTVSAGRAAWRAEPGDGQATGSGGISGMADADAAGQREQRGSGILDEEWQAFGHDADGCCAVRYCKHCDTEYPESSWRWSDGKCPDCGMGDSVCEGLQEQQRHAGIPCGTPEADARQAAIGAGACEPWRELEWLRCSDGKARPTLAIVQCVAARLSTGMVSGGADHDFEKEEVNGQTCDSNATEKLQPPYVVLALPQASTFAALRFDNGTSEVLRSLREACNEARLVLDAQHTPEEVWRSLDDEGKGRLLVAIEASGLGVVPLHPLGKNEKCRMGRLRAYGNAIVPQVAAAFIEASMAPPVDGV